jgi:hypothetical protein
VQLALTNAQAKAFRATPVTIVAAPGAGKLIIPVSCAISLVYGGTNAFVQGGAGDNFSLKYKDGTTASLMTGGIGAFTQATASAFSLMVPAVAAGSSVNISKANGDNQPLVVHNPAAAELTGQRGRRQHVRAQPGLPDHPEQRVTMSAQSILWSAATSVTVPAAGSGTSDVFQPHTELDIAALFALKVTAAAAAVGDTLDVWLQHSWDDGTTWDDFIHFTQVLGNGGAKTILCPWALYAGSPAAMHVAVTKTLTAANSPLAGPIGNQWRAQYTVAGGTATFTFGISVQQYDE